MSSKLKRYWSRFVSFYYKRNNVDDVLNLKSYKTSFNSFKELLNMKQEREAKKMAKDVFTDFMTAVADEMINNNYFVFPRRGFGYMTISNTANPEREDYIYDIDTGGKIYSPRIKISEDVFTTPKRNYKVRFNQVLRNKMYNNIINGRKY